MEEYRATAGGQRGVNGEWYEGGQFLPTSPKTIKGQQKSNKTERRARKQEIAPYLWEVAPTAKARSIYAMTSAFAKIGRDEKLELAASDQTLAYYGKGKLEVTELIERWNQGERWLA